MTILGILLTILKTIGILLLVLLLIILLILLLVLFVPIRYRVHADKDGWDMNAGASVTWLLKVLAVDISYGIRENGDRGLTKDIRIFGVSIFKVKDWLSKRKRKKPRSESPESSGGSDAGPSAAETPEGVQYMTAESQTEVLTPKETTAAAESAAADETPPEETPADKPASQAEAAEAKDGTETAETIGESQTADTTEQDGLSETDTTDVVKAPRKSLSDRLLDLTFKIIRFIFEHVLAAPGNLIQMCLALLMKIIRFFTTLCTMPGRIVALLGSGIDKVLTIFNKVKVITDFFFDDRTQDAIHLLFKDIAQLLGHIRPRTLSGYLDFGFDDPSITGRVLGFLSLFLPQCGKTFDINPDFENAHLECDLNSSGRIYLFYLVYIGVRTILNKNVKYVIRYIRHIRKELSQA